MKRGLITWERSPAEGVMMISGLDGEGRRWTLLVAGGRWMAYGRRGILKNRRGYSRHWASPRGAMRACVADARMAPREEALERLCDPAYRQA